MIQIESITKTYQVGKEPLHVLEDVTLSVDKGEWLCILGPSGSGKSTLLNCMSGMDFPQQGRVYVQGESVAEMSTKDLQFMRRNMIGFVFQDFRLLPQYTVLDNVCLPQLPYGKKQKVVERATTVIAEVGLDHRLQHLPEELSGGEKQRAAIARALFHDPQIIICDEPTGNLDRKNRDRILDLISALHQKGCTIVMATHDAEVADRGGRHIYLRDGQLQSGVGV